MGPRPHVTVSGRRRVVFVFVNRIHVPPRALASLVVAHSSTHNAQAVRGRVLLISLENFRRLRPRFN